MSTVVKDLGAATAYGYAVEKGYTGTEAEFAELMASYATVGQTAVTAAQTATTKASEAATSATTATNKASEATTAATTATTKAGEASTSASTATSAKDTAVSASQTATTKAIEAITAAATATSAATTATTAKDDAVSAKTAAQTAQTGAETAAASVQASAAQIATNTSDITELKEDFTTTASKEDMLKAFPTDTASGSVASFADGANVPVKSLIVNIDPVQSGSGDPSPDNVRPISGHTQAVVTRTGVNVWDEEWELGGIDASTGLNTEGSSSIRCKNYIPVTPSTLYYVSGLTSGNCRPIYYDADKGFISAGYWMGGTSNNPQRTPSNARYMRFYLATAYGTTYNHDISINYPSTDHDYHEGHVQSITIALGQTVYGGKLDVTNGVLTIVDAKNVYDGSDDEPWYKFNTGSAQAFAMQVNFNHAYKNSCDNLRTNYLKPIPTNATWGNEDNWISAQNNGAVITGVKAFTTLEDWKAHLAQNPLEVVYELITPLTIQLTPHEVTALLGSNNIWADTGDSEVTYRADPTLYIGRLTEPDADMVADSNITSGSYFMVGNTLYKATANIASGATISPNVNCTRKSLSEALNEINA